MTTEQAKSAIGFDGRVVATDGPLIVIRWENPNGSFAMATFEDDRLFYKTSGRLR